MWHETKSIKDEIRRLVPEIGNRPIIFAATMLALKRGAPIEILATYFGYPYSFLRNLHKLFTTEELVVIVKKWKSKGEKNV